jgi:hypothetical protein
MSRVFGVTIGVLLSIMCERSGIAMTGADDAHRSVLVSMIVHSVRAADMECLYVHCS